MREIVIWFLSLLVDVVEFVLDFKIYGDFSLLHIILGFNLIIIIFSFFKFGDSSSLSDDAISLSHRAFRNSENEKERRNYKRERQSYEKYKENRIRNDAYSKRYRDEMRNK